MQADPPECRRIYPADDLCSCKTVRHHIEQRQLRIFLETLVVPDFISAEEWAPHLSDLNPFVSVRDILQELVYEGRREPFANLHELEKAVIQKSNEIDNQTIKKAILQWTRHLAAVTKQDGDQLSTSLVEHLLRLLITDFVVFLHSDKSDNDTTLLSILVKA